MRAALLSQSFTSRARVAMGAWTPSVYIDFIRNHAIIDRLDVGDIRNIPGLTGTVNLGPNGHTIAAVGNGLTIPLTSFVYPLTFQLGFNRTTDTGLQEEIATVDSGAITDFVGWNISSADTLRLQVTTGAVSQATVNAGAGIATGVATRVIGRVDTNSVQTCRNAPAALGTEDTSVTLPANPTRLLVGIDSLGVQTFLGSVAYVGLVSGYAFPDTQLRAAHLAKP